VRDATRDINKLVEHTTENMEEDGHALAHLDSRMQNVQGVHSYPIDLLSAQVMHWQGEGIILVSTTSCHLELPLTIDDRLKE
jgi:hypothetical protein